MKKHINKVITRWGMLPPLVILVILPIAVVAALSEQTIEQHAANWIGFSIVNGVCTQNTSCTAGNANCFFTLQSCQNWNQGANPTSGGFSIVNGSCQSNSSCNAGDANCFFTLQSCQGWINQHNNQNNNQNTSSSSSNPNSSSSSSSSSSSFNNSSSSSTSSSSSSNGSSSSQSSFPNYVCAGSGVGAGCPPTPTPTMPLSGAPSSSSSISAIPSNTLSGIPSSGNAICSQSTNKACGYTDNCSGQIEGATCERQVNGCNKDSSGNNVYICKSGKWVYDHWVNKDSGSCNFCGSNNNNNKQTNGNIISLIMQLFQFLLKLLESLFGISTSSNTT